jgi:hypothetical protein
MKIQLETFTPVLNNLRGPAKFAAKRILSPDLVEAVNAIPVEDGTVDTNEALKSLIGLAAKKATGGIRRKVAGIFTVIFGIIAIITTPITFFLDGNIIIPLSVFAVIIAIIWVVTGIIFSRIANRISGIIFKAIESKMTSAEPQAARSN